LKFRRKLNHCLPEYRISDKLMAMKNENKNKDSIVCIACPICHSRIWVDAETEDVIKSEKSQKIKENLEQLLEKEHIKKSQMDRKFTSTAAMAKERRKQAEDKFAQAFSKIKDSE
jgi:Fe-S oxidoreductase